MASGTEETRRFYDNIGWKIQGDKLVDVNLFGIREDGPIRMELHKLLMDRVRSALGANVNLLECGCGAIRQNGFLTNVRDTPALISPTPALTWREHCLAT